MLELNELCEAIEFKNLSDLSNRVADDLNIIIRTPEDLEMFTNNFCEKSSIHTAVTEMRDYKLLNNNPPDITEFFEAYHKHDREAFEMLFQHSIAPDKWEDIKVYMSLNRKTVLDVYGNFVTGLQFGLTYRIWHYVM